MTEQEKKTEQMRRFATVEERRALAGRIAAGGAVLLKNEGNLLPFSGSTRVAVFGRTQINTIKGGTGSANCDCEYTVSFLDGIRGAGIPVDEHLADVYRTWTAAHPIPSFGVWGSGMHCAPEMSLDDTILADAEKNADAAIVVIGRTAGENEDVAFGEGDWYLSADERNMLGAVVSRFPGRTAVLVNSGGLIDFSFADTFGVSALLLCFMPGMEGARAIGDILAGRVTPSGKLTATVAKNYEDYPSAGHFGQTGGGIIQDYVEDIYVGYRYFLTFVKEKIRYPFGFGLSYTTFELSDCSASEENGVITVSCRVTNTGGTYSGREVAQVYFSSPQPEDGAKLYRPRRVLAGFAKTKTLLPGESETVTVSFPLSDLASFDDTGVTGHRDCFVTETGDYRVFLGNSSFADTEVFLYHQKETVFSETLTHLGTSLPARLCGDGSMETLETIPVDPRAGLRISSDGETVVPAGAVAASDTTIEADLSALHAGQSVTYRLIAGASGGYTLRFDGNASGRFSDYGELSLGGVTLTDFDADLSSAGGAGIILPSGVSDLTVTAKRDFPPVTALVFRKVNSVFRISGKGSTTFPATGFFESAYGLNVKHFSDGGDGAPVSVLSNFWNPGKFVTYKLYAEEAGIYDLTLRYANYRDDTVLSDACALFVSNVGQPIAPVPVRHTCEREDQLHLTDVTAPVQIALPAGECYFKLVSAMWQFPDVVSFTLTRSEKQAAAKREETSAGGPSVSAGYEPSLISDDRDAPRAPVTLPDVADGRHTMEDLLAVMSDDDLIRLVSGNPRNKNETGISGCICPAFLRFGIPPLETADGPLGLRINALTTAFPSGSMLASSWDPALAGEFGRAIGMESVLFDVDIWLAPGINISRDPRCGRNFEYYSEDPLLSSGIAVSVTRGVQAYGTAVCVKHFAVNNTEHERLKSDSRVSARAEREIYLRNFERVLREGDPWSVMSSYNHVNDRKASEQRELITDIAHGEWGWDGVILSDWDNDSSHVKELLAGQDIKMSAGDPEAVSAALADGTLSRRDLEIPAARILRLVMKTRAFRRYREQNGV